MDERTVYTDVDRGWAWITLAAAMASHFIVGILYYSAGVIHIALLEKFREDVATTAMVVSVFNSITSLAGTCIRKCVVREFRLYKGL